MKQSAVISGTSYIQHMPQRDPTRVSLENKIEEFEKDIAWRQEQILLLKQAIQHFPDPPSLYQSQTGLM